MDAQTRSKKGNVVVAVIVVVVVVAILRYLGLCREAIFGLQLHPSKLIGEITLGQPKVSPLFNSNILSPY